MIHLMGRAEIRSRLGLSRARIYQLTQRPDFPKPCAELLGGGIWLADDVEAWIRQYRPELAEGPDAF
ncbi:putative regulatory protein [Actinoplanes missouriensis 431]|uniref:Putative regulatory protein n=1 Tax=Actinoplanes missouriensis (strain ATCC 14538 / DSM 43046 / CBS 188.64 / JCM 3121 / NBRC 102363 / NCIMB 12654 / NRRL B-3342 / UNCC 431) TaxID=512565 RepID=I0GXG5_ACTM4|nr:putative regulatory protein [Actinoplanes missouriensis 431]